MNLFFLKNGIYKASKEQKHKNLFFCPLKAFTKKIAHKNWAKYFLPSWYYDFYSYLEPFGRAPKMSWVGPPWGHLKFFRFLVWSAPTDQTLRMPLGGEEGAEEQLFHQADHLSSFGYYAQTVGDMNTSHKTDSSSRDRPFQGT